MSIMGKKYVTGINILFDMNYIKKGKKLYIQVLSMAG